MRTSRCRLQNLVEKFFGISSNISTYVIFDSPMASGYRVVYAITCRGCKKISWLINLATKTWKGWFGLTWAMPLPACHSRLVYSWSHGSVTTVSSCLVVTFSKDCTPGWNLVRAVTLTLGNDQFFCFLNCFYSSSGNVLLAFEVVHMMGPIVPSSMLTSFNRGRIASTHLSQKSNPRMTAVVRFSTK